MINKALDLDFNEPVETYSTSAHLFSDLFIPEGTKGRLREERRPEPKARERKPREERPKRERTRRRLHNGEIVAGAGAAATDAVEKAGKPDTITAPSLEGDAADKPEGQRRRRRRGGRGRGKPAGEQGAPAPEPVEA